jgi:ABC-type transport system substrate-binding protein
MANAGELSIYLAQFPKSIDGLKTENFEQWTLCYNISDRLIEIGEKSYLNANLVDSYFYNAQEKTYTFTLQSNRYFHNGEKITAEDVVYSLQKSVHNKKSYSRLSDYIECKKNKESFNEECDGIVKLSDTQLKVSLKHFDPGFIELLDMNENAIRSKQSDLKKEIVYSGLYKVSESSESRIELSVNRRHPKYKTSLYDKITLLPLPSLENWVSLVNQKNRDTVLINKGFPSILNSKFSPDLKNAFLFANGNSAVLSIRPGIQQADAIKASVLRAFHKTHSLKEFPFLKPLLSLYPPGFALANVINPKSISTERVKAKLNVKVAKNLIGGPLREKIITLTKTEGVELTIHEVEPNELNQPFDNNKYDGIIAAPFISTQDPLKQTKGYFSGNWNFFSDPSPELLGLLNKASATSDRDSRIQYLRSFYEKLFADHAIVPLFYMPSMIFVSDTIDKNSLQYFANTITFDTILSLK